ncbi:YbaB/EbfC family nucleoid-associated protein [Candidatus Microgenomates bacterium]|nr:YbaB/EbfC family nucleoid-associated protein [Candidatus Microgenomates bacterium]
MFGKAGALIKLKQMQNQLAKERVEVDENGVKVVVSGEMKIKELQTNGQPDDKVADVINKAMEKAQKMSAGKMQEMGPLLSEMFGNK